MSELKILEEKENVLFNRKEIRGLIESDVVPSRAEILEILSKKFKVPEENIKIKKISGKFGSKTFDIEANIYSSEQEKDSIELKKKKEKKPEKKEEQAESEPLKEEQAEEKAVEEKPAEEPAEQEQTETSEEIVQDIEKSGVPEETAKEEEKLDEKAMEEKPEEKSESQVKENTEQ